MFIPAIVWLATQFCGFEHETTYFCARLCELDIKEMDNNRNFNFDGFLKAHGLLREDEMK